MISFPEGRRAAGFSLIEVLVAMTLLLVIGSIATTALIQMTNSQMTIWNRTEMHSGIRGATELLQQEVGQAGRVGLPNTVALGAPVTARTDCNPDSPAAPANPAVTLTCPSGCASPPSTTGIFASAGPPAAYMMLTTLDGDNSETFRVGAVAGSTITACFSKDHLAGAILAPLGGFATGIVPNSGVANGSGNNVLKLYGDINGDGNMVYVEYTCDPLPTVASTPTAAPPGTGNLFRNVMAYDAGAKAPIANSQILLNNIVAWPPGAPAPCFTYQTNPNPPLFVQGTPFTFILDVAVTLTVRTQQIDPVTRQFQTETKALLNVSPRNVFNAWMLASTGYTDHVQSTPATVTSLLP